MGESSHHHEIIRFSEHLANEEVARVYGPLRYDELEECAKLSKIHATVKEAVVEELTRNEFKNLRLHLP